MTTSDAAATEPAALAEPPADWAQIARDAITGHAALHNEGELTALLALLDSIRPVTVVELGTWMGGGTWALAQLPSVRHIITVDEAPQSGAAKTLENLHRQVTMITGNTTHTRTRADVATALDGVKADVILVDGGHDYRTARTDFEWAGQLGRAGGVLVMHDTQGYPGPAIVEVPRLWAEIRAVYRTTELIDRPGGPGGTGIVWL